MSKVKLKLGEMTSSVLCNYAVMSEVVRGIFGGAPEETTKGGVPEGVKNLAEGASFEAAMMQMQSALNWG